MQEDMNHNANHKQEVPKKDNKKNKKNKTEKYLAFQIVSLKLKVGYMTWRCQFTSRTVTASLHRHRHGALGEKSARINRTLPLMTEPVSAYYHKSQRVNHTGRKNTHKGRFSHLK